MLSAAAAAAEGGDGTGNHDRADRRGLGNNAAAKSNLSQRLIQAHRSGSAELPVGRQLAQIRDIDEPVEIEIAERPAIDALLPVGRERAKIGHVDDAVEVCVAIEQASAKRVADD